MSVDKAQQLFEANIEAEVKIEARDYWYVTRR